MTIRRHFEVQYDDAHDFIAMLVDNKFETVFYQASDDDQLRFAWVMNFDPNGVVILRCRMTLGEAKMIPKEIKQVSARLYPPGEEG